MYGNPVVNQSASHRGGGYLDFSIINGRYKQINDFPDYYITEHGDVYSKRLRGAEKDPKLRKLKPKNPGNNSKYLNIVLCNDDGQVTKSIHRLVAEYFVSGWFEGAVVNHIDGNNRNNEKDNLQLLCPNCHSQTDNFSNKKRNNK